MKRFRATVYHLSSMVACVEGDAGIHRFVYESPAYSKEDFKAIVRDMYLGDVDAEISFGPISEIERWKLK